MPDEVDPLQARLRGGDAKRLANHVGAPQFLLGQSAIRFQNQRDSLSKVGPCLIERLALRVRAWQFLDERNVAVSYLGNTAVS
jgi:hypothetical protein